MRDDLISREYIKAFVCEYEKFNGKETEIVKAIPIQAIDNAPTLPNPCGNPCNFIRRTGEWICTFHSTFYQYEPDEYRCSICNGVGGKSDKFCKHCGAQMKVGGRDGLQV